jgi:hypothetical protein
LGKIQKGILKQVNRIIYRRNRTLDEDKPTVRKLRGVKKYVRFETKPKISKFWFFHQKRLQRPFYLKNRVNRDYNFTKRSLFLKTWEFLIKDFKTKQVPMERIIKI